jgi:enoyl-[acyl-carrier-protein] reductase (NADH)
LILAGKRVLVTGVVDRHSIAFSIAERAQRQGAEVLLTSFGRVMRMTERAAKRLPEPTEVLELDVSEDDQLGELRNELARRWGRVDGAVHAIAFAPADALGGDFLATPRASASAAFDVSAYSLKGLAESLGPLMGGRGDGAAPSGSLVGLDFDASVAWPSYDWMGVSKAALESVSRYLARDLGPAGVRGRSAGRSTTPRRSPTPPASCSPISRAPRPARSSTSTAASTRSAPLRGRAERRYGPIATRCTASPDPIRTSPTICGGKSPCALTPASASSRAASSAGSPISPR